MNKKKLIKLFIITLCFSFVYLLIYLYSKLVDIPREYKIVQNQYQDVKPDNYVHIGVFTTDIDSKLVGILPNWDSVLLDKFNNLKIVDQKNNYIKLGKFDPDNTMANFYLFFNYLVYTNHNNIQIYKIDNNNLYKIFNKTYKDKYGISITSIMPNKFDSTSTIVYLTLSRDNVEHLKKDDWESKLIKIELLDTSVKDSEITTFHQSFIISDIANTKILLCQELPFVENTWILYDLNSSEIKELKCSQALEASLFKNELLLKYTDDVSNFCPDQKPGLYWKDQYWPELSNIQILTTYKDYIIGKTQDNIKIYRVQNDKLQDVKIENDIILDNLNTIIPISRGDIIDKDLTESYIDLKTVDGQIIYRLILNK